MCFSVLFKQRCVFVNLRLLVLFVKAQFHGALLNVPIAQRPQFDS